MAKLSPGPAPVPVKRAEPPVPSSAEPAPLNLRVPTPSEAIALVRDAERKWLVLHLKLIEGLVCDARIVERTVHLDLAQDAARRAVLGLRS